MKFYGKSLLFLAILLNVSISDASEFRYRFTLSGDVPYDWEVADPSYSDWENTGTFHDCTNWSPSPSSIGKGMSFTQTATDCQQDQSRTVTPRQQDSRTGKVEDTPGATYVVSRTINVTKIRDAVGILENWSSYEPSYTNWADTNALYGCTSWTPDPSIYTKSIDFTQTSSTCKTDQSRLRQDREQEQFTSEIRNDGEPVPESRTLTGQQQNRLYSITLNPWVNSGNVTGCANWSPDPSTVTINQSYTQTATDCKISQTRIRDEAYIDPKTGSTVSVSNNTESQVVAANSSRTATGTKETWVATSSTYTAWANSSAVYGCSTWSPSPSSYTVRTQFTQTGTGCSIDQTRTRQDRQTETTTGSVRDNGSAVAESQTVGGQTSTRTYLMDFSGWSDSGGYYNCSAYSPDASSVTYGATFTQTATCTINQTRGAMGYTYVNGAYVADPAVPYRTETQAVSRTVSQSATGTMAVAPSINSLSATVGNDGGNCTRYGTNAVISWSGSNVSSYTITGPTGTIGLGGATSYSTGTRGTYTLYAYNTAGSAVTASVTVTITSPHCSTK